MRHRMRRLVPLLLALGCVGAPAAAADLPFERLRIESPGASLGPDGVVAVKGVVARLDGDLLIADHLRYDPANDDLWASGDVVLRRPGVRIAAKQLGAHPNRQTAEAFEVEATIELKDGRRLVATAKKAEINRHEIILRDVNAHLGHGGIIGFWTHRLRVILRDERDPERRDVAQAVEGIELISPAGTVTGVPVIWLPYIYRDFVLDYPWSRVVVGSAKRLGTFARYWVGTDLPAMGDWRTGIDGRADVASIAGGGGGLRAHWWHPTWGRGNAEFFTMPAEKIRGQVDKGAELATRKQDYYDVAHYAPLAGPGSGLLMGRYVVTPDSDPVEPGGPQDANALRWMADYMPEELARRPYPTRTAAIAYGLPGGTIVVDTTRRHAEDIDATERWLGVQAISSPWQLVGPFHAGVEGWGEELHRIQRDTQAQRLTGQAYLAASQWWNGFGVDGEGGVRLLAYHDGVIAGVEQDQVDRRHQGYADAGVSVRLVERYGTWRHQVIPRLGVQLLGQGLGEALPTYDFGDPRDRLDEDQRYWTAGVTSQLDGNRPLFRAGVLTRWAMREQERYYVDDNGITRLSGSELVDVRLTADGRPVEELLLTCSALYDNRPEEWTSVNAGASWTPVRWGELRWGETYVAPTSTTGQVIQHVPGAGLDSGRYRLDGDLVMEPDGALVDTWRLRLLRRMVDGALTCGYEFIRDDNGTIEDRRVTVGFQISGSGDLSGGNGWVYSRR
jgi:hypothetical protein